ncbi:hypothetical protein ACS0TY_020221 [Phlomoides rotata]
MTVQICTESTQYHNFPLTLGDRAHQWFYSLLAGSLFTWSELVSRFLTQFIESAVHLSPR